MYINCISCDTSDLTNQHHVTVHQLYSKCWSYNWPCQCLPPSRKHPSDSEEQTHSAWTGASWPCRKTSSPENENNRTNQTWSYKWWQPTRIKNKQEKKHWKKIHPPLKKKNTRNQIITQQNKLTTNQFSSSINVQTDRVNMLTVFFVWYHDQGRHADHYWHFGGTNQPTNQPINQSTSQSINQPTSQSTSQSINQSINQPTSQSINQPSNQPTSQPTNQLPDTLTVCMRVDSALATNTKTSASRQNLSIHRSKSGDTSTPGLKHPVARCRHSSA